jgi:hypothetical protein
MKKTALLLILSCLCLTGCSKKEEKNETINKPQEVKAPPTTTPVPTQTEKKEEPNKQAEDKNNSKAIRVNFPPGKNEMLIKGKIKGLNDKITYVVQGNTGQTLFVKLMATYPDKNPDANLNIASIISPSGKVEGPFGVKKMLPLTEAGDWKVIVGEVESFKSWQGEYDFIIDVH